MSGNDDTRGRDELAAAYGERTVRALDDFLDHAAMAARLLAHGRDALTSDETVRLATEAVMHRLGVSVARMDPQFVEDHPQLGLRDIKDARNVAPPDCQAIAHRIFWDAFEIDLPPTVAGIRDVLHHAG